MSGTTDAEREELRRTVRAFLAEHCAEGALRRAVEADPGYDPGVWRRLAGELGLTALGLPEACGGVGTVLELGLVVAELGRVLYSGPFLSTALAGQALRAAGDDASLPALAAGDLVGCVAIAEPDGRWRRPGPYATTAHRRADGAWHLRGTKSFVVDGMAADLILVAAQSAESAGSSGAEGSEAGPALFAVREDAPGLTRRRLATLDLTRRQAQVELADTPARRLGGAELIEHVLDAAAVLLALEQAAGARHLLELTTAYAKERVQFGRPIGSFQAVKHKLADVLVRVESAHSAAHQALASWASGDPELPLAASLAQAYCAEAYVHAAQEAVQLHGGIGFTWEHSAHLYLKRARSTHQLFDPPHDHRARMAALLVPESLS